ncbi:MAG: nucleotidyltransferase domain-containing protein [Candidatus Rokubacteria bacterium]|nr:nucleotidyltransferase domain-containing protein [Candidatus Rokubacteria bacterium]
MRRRHSRRGHRIRATTIRSSDLPIAQVLAERVVSRFGSEVRRVILFGSRARGDARSDSDFDLLVVVRRLRPEDYRPLLVALYEVLRGAGVVAEPWVMGEEEFEESKTVIGGLAYPAWKEGIVLHEAA